MAGKWGNRSQSMDLILYIAKVQNYAKSVVDVLWPVPNDDYRTDAKCDNWFHMHVNIQGSDC